MTVNELIKELKAMPQDAEVGFEHIEIAYVSKESKSYVDLGGGMEIKQSICSECKFCEQYKVWDAKVPIADDYKCVHPSNIQKDPITGEETTKVEVEKLNGDGNCENFLSIYEKVNLHRVVGLSCLIIMFAVIIGLIFSL